MNCSDCSNPLTPNAKFCKSCGAKQNSSAAPTEPIGKTCDQCHAVCKPQARFCTLCGAVFDTSAAVAPAQAAPTGTAATISLTEPPLIEAMDLPINSFDTSQHTTHHTSQHTSNYASQNPAHSPSFPLGLEQEPAPSKQSWVKWAALALIIAAIAGGVMMANNMKAMTGANSTPTASQTDKDAMSPEDKAKADALVGPQGGNTASTTDIVPLNDASSVTVAPAVEAPFPAASNPASQLPPPSAAPSTTLPTASTASGAALPPALPAAAPNRPAAPRVQPTKQNTAPSLDDLLD